MTFPNGLHGEIQKIQEMGGFQKKGVFIKRGRKEIFKKSFFPQIDDTTTLNLLIHSNLLTVSGFFHIIEFIKLVSAIFYQFFIFSPNHSSSKTIKNVVFFIEKSLFVLDIFRFL